MIQALMLTFAYYVLIGMAVAFAFAGEAIQRRDFIGKIMSPLEWAFGVVVVGLIWPVILADLWDSHKNGPWKG